jgi:peptide/nickel transport system permease protein
MATNVEQLPESALAGFKEPAPSGILIDTLRNILRQRVAIVGLILLVFLIFVAIFAQQIAPYGESQVLLSQGGTVRAAPCIHILGCPANQAEHFFGLDGNGRDEFSRVVYGSRISLLVGFVTVGFAIVIGTLTGAIAGFAGGWVDNILMRLMDVLLAFPALLLAVAIVTVIGKGLFQAMIAIGIVAIPIYARVMRASVLAVRETDFVTAARALGESSSGLLLRRVLPNALTPLVVQATLGIAGAVLDVAALSFLGLGAQAPTPEWGSMIGADRGSIFTAPHLILFPGFAITTLVLGFNLLGDGLRDALDPRLNR